MSRMVILIAFVVGGAVATATADAQAQVEDQAAIYDLVIADVARSIATPTMIPAAHLPALVPFLFAPEELRRWEPGPQVPRMTDTLLRALRKRRSTVPLCEPVADNACRGTIRGGIVRVTALRGNSPDTAEVGAQLTQARAEVDRTEMVPRPLYYRYVVVRERSGWRIHTAQRMSLDPRTA